MSTRTKQTLMVVVTAACGAAIEVFGPKGPWSHAFWAPVAVALLTELRTALGLSAMPTVSVAEVKGRVTGATQAVGLLLALALSVTSCAHASPPVGTFGHCTDAALTDASRGILGDVVTALATGNYVAELAGLTTQFGAAEVGCAVDLAIAEFTAKAARSDDTEVAVILTHAQAWRGSNP